MPEIATRVRRATIDDLHEEPGKAELIDGRIERSMPTGSPPGRVGGRIFRSLYEHCENTGRGKAYPDNVGFECPVLSSGRESFSPDAAYYDQPIPDKWMRFLPGAPVLAVEVRSEGDYRSGSEAEMAAKRDDYFEAGTLVVWDVDPIAECVQVYERTRRFEPITYRRGDTAEAEPAVPGWRVEVDWIFR